MPIHLVVENPISPAPRRGQIDLRDLAFACEAAVAAAARAASPARAIDGALGALHDELGEIPVAAFVLEHGRLWAVGVRGYAMIPDGLSLDEGLMALAVRTSEVQVAEQPSLPGSARGNGVMELAVPLLMPTGVVGVIKLETEKSLPTGCETVVAPLVTALASPMEELRVSRTVDLSSLARLFVHMSSLRDPVRIAQVSAESLGRVLPLETSQLLLLDDDGQLVESAEWSAGGRGPEPLPRPVVGALRERLDASAVFELFDAGATDVDELAGMGLRSVVLIPLRANGAEIGLLVGTSRFAGTFDRGQGELASLLAAHTAASLDAAIALDRERRSAHTDALTGLLNRRGLEDRLDRELETAQEDRIPLSLAVLDCDDFKDVNDRAGHAFGDALLREVGLVLRTACPAGSFAARLGGDEFVVMLPGMDADAAVLATEKIRRELGKGLDDAGFPLRLSAGISTYPYDGKGATSVLRAADQALFRAKARGKNSVISFREIARGVGARETVSARVERTREAGTTDVSSLDEILNAATAIWAEESVGAVLERLGKSVTFVVGATATVISKVEGRHLADTAKHALREVDLGAENTYLIDEYPVTREALETGSIRSISFLDDDLDGAEAFVLRELRMNAVMLAPLIVTGRSWGLVELYDQRLRHFTVEEESVAGFLVGQAARRIESLEGSSGSRRRLRRPHLPATA